MQWDVDVTCASPYSTTRCHCGSASYLVTKNGFVELLPVPRQARSLEVQEEANRGLEGLHASIATCSKTDSEHHLLKG